ncbi:MAG: SDR family oxidoreductase [Planctomycetes bacterium]|nr:SDR family oxidoreductase [Planctomycetota bacterium]
MTNARVAFITGASGNIGSAIAREFLEAGYTVLGGYLKNGEPIESLRRYGNVVAQQIDLASNESIRRTATMIKETPGRIDVLVNNAGINAPNDFDKIEADDWDHIFAVNLRGMFLLTKELLGTVSDGGAVINIASFSGQVGGPRTTHYAAAKAGVIALTQNMARFLAPRKIRVNCVSPGLIESEMAKAAMRSPLMEWVLLGRPGKAEEVASVVLFLASDKASYITAQTINVNGGLCF